jgi:hypothetical protein
MARGTTGVLKQKRHFRARRAKMIFILWHDWQGFGSNNVQRFEKMGVMMRSVLAYHR